MAMADNASYVACVSDYDQACGNVEARYNLDDHSTYFNVFLTGYYEANCPTQL